MGPQTYDGASWPTPHQELLLRAALLEGDEAMQSWFDWRSRVEVDLLGRPSRRLLPLLYRNLRSLGVQDPLMPKLKRAYQSTWYRNQIRFRDMGKLLSSFHEAGIRTMLLKGVAMALLHYDSPGLRPMDDGDVLVLTEQAPAAVELLTSLGWRPRANESLLLTTKDFKVLLHAANFWRPDSAAIDLHWHVLDECGDDRADTDFWHHAVPVEVGGVKSSALSPTDQLLHLCVHGVAHNGAPRWVADAMVLLKKWQAEMDWDRLLLQARRRRLALVLREALLYLRHRYNAEVPSVVLRSVELEPVSAVERIEQVARTRIGESAGPLRRLVLVWAAYLRRFDSRGAARQCVGFCSFARPRSQLESAWQIPQYVISRAAQTTRGLASALWSNLTGRKGASG